MTTPQDTTPANPAQVTDEMAWVFEEYYLARGGIGNWHERVAFSKPSDGPTIRNVRALCLAATASDLLSAIKQLMPSNLGSLPATMPDSAVLPLDVTFGELRYAMAAIARAEGRSDA